MFQVQRVLVLSVYVLLLMHLLVELGSASKTANSSITNSKNRTKRGASRLTETEGMSRLWKDGIIPYELHPDFEPHRYLIESAMMKIMLQSCVLFRPKQYQNRSKELLLKRNGGVLTVEKGQMNQCAAHVGYVESLAGSVLYLDSNVCFNVGIILHELMHVLGLGHEHQPSDREQNLQINYENFRNFSFIRHYNKKNVSGKKILTEFDTDSITNYGPVDGSKNKTIESNVPGTQVVLPEDMLALSPLDVKAINELYKCPSVDENACMKFELLYSYISDCSIEARKYISLPLKKKFIDQCR